MAARLARSLRRLALLLTVILLPGMALQPHAAPAQDGPSDPQRPAWLDHHDQATLVLIHGLGASADVWIDLKSYLGSTFDIRTYELHGHGSTPPLAEASIAGEAAALAEWIEAQGLREAILVGHGLGGTIALRCALDHPEAAGRLILLDAGPRQITNAEHRQATVRALRDEYDRFVAYQYLDISEDESINERVLDLALRTDSTSFASLLLSSFETDLSDRLAQLSVPVLVIGSAAFLPVAGKEREYLTFYGFGALEDFQFRRLEDTGHYLILERPSSVAALILVWLRDGRP